jgi:hypothetical protein
VEEKSIVFRANFLGDIQRADDLRYFLYVPKEDSFYIEMKPATEEELYKRYCKWNIEQVPTRYSSFEGMDGELVPVICLDYFLLTISSPEVIRLYGELIKQLREEVEEIKMQDKAR